MDPLVKSQFSKFRWFRILNSWLNRIHVFYRRCPRTLRLRKGRVPLTTFVMTERGMRMISSLYIWHFFYGYMSLYL